MLGIIILVAILAIAFFLWRKSQKVVVIERGGELKTVRKFDFKPYFVWPSAVAILILFILAISIRTVPVGHAMVKFNVITKRFSVAHEGITLVLPFVYRTKVYDLRRQEYTMSARKGEGKKKNVDDSLWSPTKEGLQVGIDLTCWYKIASDKVVAVHRGIGPDFAEKVVRPAIRSVVRHVISEYAIMDVYSAHRQQIQEEIKKRIKQLLEPDGFVIEDVILRDVHFTADFAKAIERKQIAQQEAERMEYVLEKEQKEAERKKIEAQGTARAIEIVSVQLKRNPEYIKYLYVDKLSDKIKVIVADQSTILDLKGMLEEK